MKTILFIDKGEKYLWESFVEHEYLFDEFLQEDELMVCDWRRDGKSVSTAIPSLVAVLGDEEEWNAIVVTDLRGADGMPRPEDDRFFGNPYDFVENYDVGYGDAIVESRRPIIRLSQMLGGVPDRVALEYAPRVALNENSNTEGMTDEAGDLDSIESFAGEPSIIHPRGDEHFDLLERYRLGVPNPRRILLLTPRDMDEDLEFELTRCRNTEDRSEARRFWERNAYAANARFLVCDFAAPHLCDEETVQSGEVAAAEYALEQRRWFGFWMALLTLTQANLSGDDLKPYELYRLQIQLDDDEFSQTLAKRRGTWEAALDVLKTRMSLEQSLMTRSEYNTSNMPDCSTNIPIEFDLVSSDKLEVDSRVVGLFRDKPVNDLRVWAEERRKSVEELNELLRAPRRGVRNAVTLFHHTNSMSAKDLEYCILNTYELEKLEDELEAEELEFVRDTRVSSFEYGAYRKPIEQCDANVRSRIEYRSAKKANILITIITIMMFSIGMVPLFAGSHSNPQNSAVALAIVIACGAVLAIVSFATLLWQRAAIRKEYGRYNEVMRGIFSRMRGDANKVGNRISRFATFKKSQAVLDRQHRKGTPTERLIWLRMKSAKLKKRLERLNRLADGDAGIDRIAYRRVMKGGWEALYDELNDEAFFLLHEYDLVRRPLNRELRNGKMIEVPFSFISNVSLRQISLYEYSRRDDDNARGGGGAA